jgi:hydroxypyruvate reductase
LTPDALLRGAFDAAVAAVRAPALLPPHLPRPPHPSRGRLIVVGAGKAAVDMAACVEAHYPPEVNLEGLVITRHGHGLPTRRIEVVEAGHPLPDDAGLDAVPRLMDWVAAARGQDRVLALISGGGSSLLSLPMGDITLQELRGVTGDLLRSGAPIAYINAVRKHLCHPLGGRLALLAWRPVTALLLSDVTGDDPAVIASGPFAPDPTTFDDALAILARWGVTPPAAVQAHLEMGARGDIHDTPKPGDAGFAQVESRVIGNGLTALQGAAAWLEARGVRCVVQGAEFAGEARELARRFAAETKAAVGPVCLLSGGEAQVTVRGRGRGGRNAEFLLALALELQGQAGIHALAADTDGIDGTEDNAGALIGPDTLARAAALGLDPRAHLDDNDAYGFFAALGELLVTGPTRTNANDFRAILKV